MPSMLWEGQLSTYRVTPHQEVQPIHRSLHHTLPHTLHQTFNTMNRQAMWQRPNHCRQSGISSGAEKSFQKVE